jgi:hypothetical protein
MSQQDTSRAAVERLAAELGAAGEDSAYREALTDQIRLHAELAGLSADELAALVNPPKPAKAAKAAKPVEG